MRPDPLPATRAGFCQGCKRFVERMTLTQPGRYRCDDCAIHGETAPRQSVPPDDANMAPEQKPK